jgi:hypothetical protein
MYKRIIKLVLVFVVVLSIFIGLLSVGTGCSLIDRLIEKNNSSPQEEKIELEINKKLIGLNLTESTKDYLLKALQEKPEFLENINSGFAFWEWLGSNQSANYNDINIAIEIAGKDISYCPGFIDSLLELSEEELSELLTDDSDLEKKYREFTENLTDSFFDNNILFNIDKQTYLSYFPEDTKELVFLPEEVQGKVKNVIVEAMEAYPTGFVPQNLQTLYILGNQIMIENVNDATALVIDNTIFITNGKKDNEILYLPVFHHVFNHLLQNKYKELFDSYYEEWISNNPEGFKYYGYESYYRDEDKVEIYKDSFISTYSVVNYSEDFAEIATNAFSKDSIFFDSIMDHPGIKNKFELMVDFCNKINPNITLEYFERISGQKLGYSE